MTPGKAATANHMRSEKRTIRDIAKTIDVSEATVVRELERQRKGQQAPQEQGCGCSSSDAFLNVEANGGGAAHMAPRKSKNHIEGQLSLESFRRPRAHPNHSAAAREEAGLGTMTALLNS